MDQAAAAPGRTIPGPPRRWDRNLLALGKDRIGFLRALAKRYGDVVAFDIGGKRAVLLNHPDHVRDVLVTRHGATRKSRGLQEAKRVLGEGLITSEGEVQRRHRRMLQPMFDKERVAQDAGAIVDEALDARNRWHDGQPIAMDREMLRFTLTTVGRTLFGAEMAAHARRIEPALDEVIRMFNWAALPLKELILRLPIPRVIRFHHAKRDLDAAVQNMITQRRQQAARGERASNDLLSLLLSAQDIGTEGTLVQAPRDGPRLNDTEIRDQVLTILLAGHETTGQALAWTWRLLADHPDAERRMHNEIDTVLAGRLPKNDDVPNLEYTRRVFAEAVRLYPPVWVLGREATEDLELGGHHITAGTTLVVSQMLLHRDERFWGPDAEKFNPDRFSPEATATRPRLAYFPFSAGPRTCIGEPYAWLVGVLALATIAQRWKFSAEPGHRIALDPSITLRPKGGLPMVCHSRT